MLTNPGAPTVALLLGTDNADGTFTGVTTGTTRAIDATGMTSLAFYVIGNGTCSTGVVTFEEAFYDPTKDSPYTGTWSSITTSNASSVTGGAQQAVHLGGSGGVYNYRIIRARISTTVTGGGGLSIGFAGQ